VIRQTFDVALSGVTNSLEEAFEEARKMIDHLEPDT
jgi:SHS2 domain-containing protein